MVQMLSECNFPVSSLRLMASHRSSGTVIKTAFGDKVIEVFSVNEARKTDFAFLAVSGDFSRQFAWDLAAPGGPIVIDNSSAMRLLDNVPLVVPEINLDAVKVRMASPRYRYVN